MMFLCINEEELNMNIIIVLIIAILSVAVLISRYLRRREIQEHFTLEFSESIDKSCLMLTIQPCRSIIDKALECILSYDDIEVCRNHRLGSAILDALEKKVMDFSDKGKDADSVPAIYYSYMLDATEKIAETSRHIITSPDNYVPISYKCEIETIRGNLDRLLQSTDNMLHSDKNAESLREEINKDKDFIKHTIAVHTKGMTHEEFDDGAPAYSYLMLLYYLHSFMCSFSHVVNLSKNTSHCRKCCLA